MTKRRWSRSELKELELYSEDYTLTIEELQKKIPRRTLTAIKVQLSRKNIHRVWPDAVKDEGLEWWARPSWMEAES